MKTRPDQCGGNPGADIALFRAQREQSRLEREKTNMQEAEESRHMLGLATVLVAGGLLAAVAILEFLWS